MKIAINDKRKIVAIQAEFNAHFVNLTLGFYAKSNSSEGAASKKLITHGAKTLAECRTTHENGDITITPNMTGAELERRFCDVYGISVEILQKRGNEWKETTSLKGLTLDELNKND